MCSFQCVVNGATCKISRSIDLRCGMKNKISLLLLENIWALVEFHYRAVSDFLSIFAKILKKAQKTETVRYLYFTEVRQFQSISRISLPYHTISDFLSIFAKISKKAQKKPKRYGTCILPRFGNFRASVEFHYRTVPFRIFRGQNETAWW